MFCGTRFALPRVVNIARLVSPALAITVLASAASACGSSIDRDMERQAMSNALATRPDGAPARETRAAVRAFYDARDQMPAWRTSRDVDAVIRLIEDSATHGLTPEDYGAGELGAAYDAAQSSRASGPGDRAMFDLRVTTALLTMGHDVAMGRTPPEAVDARWESQREKLDLAGSLAEAVEKRSLGKWLERLAPRHPGYAELRDVLTRLRAADPIDEGQIARVAANLDRWRWLPDDLGARHFSVNVPEYLLRAREGGRTVFDMRVVVGKAGGNETPIFSDEMETVVFSPYWHIPASIATAETAPAATRDPEYLARQRIEVVRAGSDARPIDPDDINWDDEDEVRGLKFRQQPGAGNALGKVKFLFPNRHAVYLHDTPSTAHFKREDRAQSHGCVRVAEPARLAQYVLGDQAEWSDERIAAAMGAAAEKVIRLTNPIPVHITYFTVVAGPDGQPTFLPDVYGHDARHLRAVTRRSLVARAR